MGSPDPQVRDEKRAAHRALVDSVLHGPGTTTVEQREAAFQHAEVDPALQPLLGKVATGAAGITDADFDRARAAGLSDDQVFELVIAAAVGHSTRMYESGLAALDEAAG
jgi:alkylhydroperoxidase family enzyme